MDRGKILFIMGIMVLSLFFTGCDFLASISDFSISLTVSQGTYEDEIDINWSSIHGDGVEALGYDLYRRGPDDSVFYFINSIDPSITSYSDFGVDPGRTYEYYVVAETQDEDGYIDTDETYREEGFAMVSENLEIYSSENQSGHILSTSTATDYADICWMEFIAQKNWSYRFLADASSPELQLSIISPGNLEQPLAISSTEDLQWKATTSGKVYLRITVDSFSDEGTPFGLKAWHTDP